MNLKKNISAFFAWVIPFILCAQTSVPGGTVSGVWSAAGSPYTVQGSIMVPDNNTLTIQPGVTVTFAGHYKLVVKGSLNAQGTAASPIAFAPASQSTGWYGIRIDSPMPGNDSTILSHCSLSYGDANGSGDDACGGAVFIKSWSRVRISHCELNNNKANYGAALYTQSSSALIAYNNLHHNSIPQNGYGGGAINASGGSPNIRYNTISNNASQLAGGGIVAASGTVVSIVSNTVTNNTANFGGGGIYCSSNSTLLISGNVIKQNTGTGYNGGGIYVIYGRHTEITGNIIGYNRCSQNGGAINCNALGKLEIRNNYINNNQADMATSEAGGIFLSFLDSVARITGNVIVNNSTPGKGGGTSTYNANALYTNNTIANNYAAVNGGGMAFASGSDGQLKNNIVYGNSSSGGGKNFYMHDEDSDPSFNYNNIQGGATGFDLNANFFTGTYLNNIDLDPLFVTPSAGTGDSFAGDLAVWKLNVAGLSSCIDAGDPSGNYPATDIAGNNRVMGSRIDMGAYESTGVVGIEEQMPVQRAEVYPNPFSDHAVIRTPYQTVNASLQVYNMQGQKVLESTGFSGKEIELNKGMLAPGHYFFRLQDDNGPACYGRFLLGN